MIQNFSWTLVGTKIYCYLTPRMLADPLFHSSMIAFLNNEPLPHEAAASVVAATTPQPSSVVTSSTSSSTPSAPTAATCGGARVRALITYHYPLPYVRATRIEPTLKLFYYEAPLHVTRQRVPQQPHLRVAHDHATNAGKGKSKKSKRTNNKDDTKTTITAAAPSSSSSSSSTATLSSTSIPAAALTVVMSTPTSA
jgi:hypothetical protein